MKTFKFKDKQTKTSLVVEMGLDSNKCLKAGVKTLYLNGEKCWNSSQKGLEVLKTFDPELAELASLSGYGLDSASMHFEANTLYYCKQTKEQLGKDIIIREEVQESCSLLWESLNNHQVFDKAFKVCGEWLVGYLKSYINKSSEHYEYFNADRALSHYVKELGKRHNIFGGITKSIKSPEKGCLYLLMKDYFEGLRKYKSLQDDLKYTNRTEMINRSDVWTPERLADELNVNIKVIYRLMCAPNPSTFERDAKLLIHDMVEMKIDRLNYLVDKYNVK